MCSGSGAGPLLLVHQRPLTSSSLHRQSKPGPTQLQIVVLIALRTWYCLVLVVVPSAWTKTSEAQLYLNGELQERLSLPQYLAYDQVAGAAIGRAILSRAPHGHAGSASPISIGSLPVPMETPVSEQEEIQPFFGQLGPTLLCSEAATAEQVRQLATIGPNYDGDLVHPPELDSSAPEALLLLAKTWALSSFANRLLFHYHPVALIEGKCHDLSAGKPVECLLSGKARNVTVVSRQTMKGGMAAIGGVRMLLPLFLMLNHPHLHLDGTQAHPEFSAHPDLCLRLFKLVCSLLVGVQGNQAEMEGSRGFEVVSFLLLQTCTNPFTSSLHL